MRRWMHMLCTLLLVPAFAVAADDRPRTGLCVSALRYLTGYVPPVAEAPISEWNATPESIRALKDSIAWAKAEGLTNVYAVLHALKKGKVDTATALIHASWFPEAAYEALGNRSFSLELDYHPVLLKAAVTSGSSQLIQDLLQHPQHNYFSGLAILHPGTAKKVLKAGYKPDHKSFATVVDIRELRKRALPLLEKWPELARSPGRSWNEAGTAAIRKFNRPVLKRILALDGVQTTDQVYGLLTDAVFYRNRSALRLLLAERNHLLSGTEITSAGIKAIMKYDYSSFRALLKSGPSQAVQEALEFDEFGEFLDIAAREADGFWENHSLRRMRALVRAEKIKRGIK